MADGVPRRGISSEFERELKAGVLQPILNLVKNDDTLSLEIRNGYVDIYYRGGLLLGLEEQSRGRFSAVFDKEYLGKTAEYHIEPRIVPPPTITAPGDTAAWLEVMPIHKQAMDIRFSLIPRLEREFEQAAERDNGRHEVGEQTDYLIVDIEYGQSSRACPGWPSDCRFDMVGFRWPIAGKTRRCKLATPVIMEMKVGDGVITSQPEGKDRKLSPGLLKHVIDIEAFLKPAPGAAFSEPYLLLREELLEMFRTKQELGLPSVPKNMVDLEIEGLTDRPEVLFVLANHNPRSRKLANELARIARIPYGEHADYKVATVTYGGYGLFRNNVVPLQDFDATPKRG